MGLIIPPYRIYILSKYLKTKKQTIKILDIGCGSNSPSITKKAFPTAHYTGVDIDKNYNNSLQDIQMIDSFIQMDLNHFDSTLIPNNEYDLIIMSHIIEHLTDGDKIIQQLLPKLKIGGFFYIEFPSEKSVSFPSMPGTLNFFDDDTHCRIYSITEICNLFLKQAHPQTQCPEFKIIKVGTVRQWINIFLLPLKALVHFIKFKHCKGGIFWDLYGFAHFVIAQKIPPSKSTLSPINQ